MLVVVVAAVLLGLQGRNGPPLEAWHTEHLSAEFTARKADEIRTFDDYLDLEDRLFDGTGNDNIDNLPGRFNDFADDDWLIGLGFSRDQQFRRGWNFSVGVKLSTPLEPYVRTTYRWLRSDGGRWLWRIEPLVFAQSQRGIGASITNTFDYAASDRWLLRTWTILQGEDDIAGLGWTQKFTVYQSISDKSAKTISVLALNLKCSLVTGRAAPRKAAPLSRNCQWRRTSTRLWRLPYLP